MRTSLRMLLVTGLLLTLGPVAVFAIAADSPYIDSFKVWPAAALGTGLLMLTAPRRRPAVAVVVGVLTGAASLLAGVPAARSAAMAVGSAGAAWLVTRIITLGRAERPALEKVTDENRFLLGTLAGLLWLVACLTVGLAVTDTPRLADAVTLVAAAQCASLLVLIPLFCRLVRRTLSCSLFERVGYWLVAPAITLVVFLPHGAPELMFAIITVLSWAASRGAMWECFTLTALVGLAATVATGLGYGPVAAFARSYGLSQDLASAVMYLFLIACSLCTLPLATVIGQQYVEGIRASSERAMLNDVVEAASSTVIVAADAAGRITLFNAGAAGVLGYRPEEVMGRSPRMFHEDEEIARLAAELDVPADYKAVVLALADLPSEESHDVVFVRKDGTHRNLSMTMTRIVTGSGRLTGFLCAASDVTDRVEEERAVVAALDHERRAVERLQEIDEVKTTFVATVSHELRTPMTNIIGFTELLGDALATGAEPLHLYDYVSRIDRNSHRMLGLIENLLTLSRVESDGLELEPERVDLRTVVSDAHHDMEPRLAQRHLDVRLELPHRPIVQVCDPLLIERVVTNLLSNAVKFTPDGGRIVLRVDQDDERSEILVSDSGLGISAADQARLFTRFFRAFEANNRQIQGFGLGLSIVRAIATVHGGSVSVQSQEDVGSTFRVVLPRTLPPGVRERAGQASV